ncbi:MAG TPA: hypothetical protein VFS44_08740 [Gemmatimonadaceae bacterium]|nr:hypothetical protein [Gemmatimonadaceae bacterium]
MASAAVAAFVVLLWVGGMLLAFHPMILSGLRLIQRDWGDTRLNMYILEHGWRWLVGVPGHERLWSPPVFHPAPNTFAYSDVMLAIAPPYWLLRAMGLPADTAFQWWELLMATLNYVVALLFLRRVVRVGTPAAALGAAVFAFAGMRIAQIQHPHLVPEFYLVTAAWGAARLFDGDGSGEAPRGRAAWWWIALLFASVVAQLWSAFYYGWYLVCSLGIVAAWALVWRDTRTALARVVWRHARALAVACAASALALWPLASHYLTAARQVGMRDFWRVEPFLARPASWLFLGVESRAYGWLWRYHAFSSIPMGYEQRLGLGFITTMIVGAGLWRARHRPLARLLVLLSFTIVLLVTLWPGGITPWRLVWAFVPGGAALRVIARFSLVLLVPAAVGVALFVDALGVRGWAGAVVLAATAVVIGAEQWQDLLSYDKYAGRERVAIVANAIPPGCGAFLFAPPDGRQDPWWYHMDAMWASLETGVPTINGYSGNEPPGWPFYDNVVRRPAHERQLLAALDAWARRWGLDRSRLCMVSPALPE